MHGDRTQQMRAQQQDAAGLSRRAALGVLGLGGLAAAAAAAGCGTEDAKRPAAAPPEHVIPFREAHQPGIVTATQSSMVFTALDVTTSDVSDFRDVLRAWSQASAALMTGAAVPAIADATGAVMHDSAEARGLGPSRLTITIGFGPGLFERFPSLRRPAALEPLPHLPGDELQGARSGGDVGLQVCADDPQVAFHATHALVRLAHGAAGVRWSQLGFGRSSTTARSQSTPRNLMGFRDGTNNLRGDDRAALNRHVWVTHDPQAPWMAGGTYLVVRRIRMLFDVWDGLDDVTQEHAVGRRKDTGAPLGGRREHDRVDLRATSAEGPVIPRDAHVRLASPQENDGIRILRRGYSYYEGADPATGQIDAGLFFISFQHDPASFVALQRRLGVADALSRHLSHTGSAVFACPPGAAGRPFVGADLFAI